ncbi:MAG: hypothetical protein EZS28_001401 [Streblomastix strix]|uniref:Uncharacterized protein n=1 Tax=Streblomastix strix TaxID=222440 RepID=A0A5J4X984_9EUKA|nr:MAG: hypothetical protein EZS28_001401 [Streblomastix strix]
MEEWMKKKYILFKLHFHQHSPFIEKVIPTIISKIAVVFLIPSSFTQEEVKEEIFGDQTGGVERGGFYIDGYGLRRGSYYYYYLDRVDEGIIVCAKRLDGAEETATDKWITIKYHQQIKAMETEQYQESEEEIQQKVNLKDILKMIEEIEKMQMLIMKMKMRINEEYFLLGTNIGASNLGFIVLTFVYVGVEEDVEGTEDYNYVVDASQDYGIVQETEDYEEDCQADQEGFGGNQSFNITFGGSGKQFGSFGTKLIFISG